VAAGHLQSLVRHPGKPSAVDPHEPLLLPDSAPTHPDPNRQVLSQTAETDSDYWNMNENTESPYLAFECQVRGLRLLAGVRLHRAGSNRRRMVVGSQAVKDGPRLVVAVDRMYCHQVAAGLDLALVVLGIVLGQT
jgi:hypothetical protein